MISLHFTNSSQSKSFSPNQQPVDNQQGSLATSGGLAGGYIVGLVLATTFLGVERRLLRTAAATGCIVIPWGDLDFFLCGAGF